MIRNILKMATDTRLDARKDFFDSSHGLSIGTVRFYLGWPWGVVNQNHSFWCKIYVDNGMSYDVGPNEHEFRSHRQQQPGPFVINLWPSCVMNRQLHGWCFDAQTLGQLSSAEILTSDMMIQLYKSLVGPQLELLLSWSKQVSKYNNIVVRPKASWADLICCTYQHYHRLQWLPNIDWSKSQRSAGARIDGY